MNKIETIKLVLTLISGICWTVLFIHMLVMRGSREGQSLTIAVNSLTAVSKTLDRIYKIHKIGRRNA